jgi:hypothetical protein
MSWAQCFSGSNNVHFDFPPIMADGRNYASWQPEAVINQRIQKQEQINSNWAYRKFMIENGLEIMKYNKMEACYDMGLSPYYDTNKTPSSNVPYMYRSIFDSSNPGYGYCNSDLKNPYLNRQQLQARMMAPSIILSPNRSQDNQDLEASRSFYNK